MTKSISPPLRGGAGATPPSGGVLEGLHARFLYADGVYELELPAGEGGGRRSRCPKQGETEFALVEEGPLLLLCYRIGDAIPWAGALYEPAQARGRGLRLEAEPMEPRALLAIMSPARAVLRNVTLSMDFTRALREALRDQERLPYDPGAHRRALTGLARRFPTVRSLVSGAMIRGPGSD